MGMAVEVTHLNVQVGSVTMNYATCGTGPVVTLLHPVGLNGLAWQGQFQPLADHFRVLAPDLRGHGGSTGGDQPFSLDDLVGDVIALWDSLGIASSHLVGLSMGGMVAQGLVLTAPDRIRSLVLVDTVGTLNEQGRAAMQSRAALAREQGMASVVESTLERWFTAEALAAETPAIAATRAILLADDPVAHAHSWAAIAGLAYLERLGQVTCPTLVVVGEKDVSTPVPAAEALVRAIPGARLAVVPGAAHIFPVETPGALTSLLIAFLQ
jgi:3-oxoadipate enol-lactonase